MSGPVPDLAPLATSDASIMPGRRRSWLWPGWGAAKRVPLLVAGLVLSALIIIAGVLAPWITPYPEDAGAVVHPTQALLAPSAAHWFGTDIVGRDVFTRVVFGARVSLGIVVIVLVVSAVVGLSIGLAAGFFGGWLDAVLMRVTDIFLAFPALLLSIALAAVLSPSALHAALAIAFTWWPWYARLARGQAASIRRQGYSDAARILGASRTRQLVRHVLPNASTPVFVQMSLDAAGIILTAATLSYLGLGAQDPTPEWGLMVAKGQPLATTAWWVITFPGLAILVTAVAFNFVGDGLQSVFDPKRGRR
ncbi:MAG: ABC transporter permease [Actinobacteria bacterium]|nr:ABC transporter permease [Actinomycetota bacterium]